jgi:Spy/CpxP family protein refolding chaperone
MQGNSKSQILKHFLAASAAFLVAGGAFAQAAATAPAPAQRGAMHNHMEHGGGMWMKSVDTDGDGMISKAEADALFNRIDTNHDGKLDKNELAAYRKTMMEQRRAEMQQEFEAKFKAADKNGDGALTRDEVKAGLPRLAQHFDQLDANHDGKLTLDEIKAGMEKMHQERMQRMQRGPGAPSAPSSSGG